MLEYGYATEFDLDVDGAFIEQHLLTHYAAENEKLDWRLSPVELRDGGVQMVNFRAIVDEDDNLVIDEDGYQKMEMIGDMPVFKHIWGWYATIEE